MMDTMQLNISLPKDTIKKDKQNGKYFISETVQYGKFWRDKLVYKYRQN